MENKTITLSTTYTRLEAFQMFQKLAEKGFSKSQVCGADGKVNEESQIVRLARFIGFNIWIDAQIEYYSVLDNLKEEAEKEKENAGTAQDVLTKAKENMDAEGDTAK